MKMDIGTLQPYKELITDRLCHDQPVDFGDLRPYTSLVVARTAPRDTLVVNQVFDAIRELVLELDALDDRRVVTHSPPIDGQALVSNRIYTRFLHYIELRAPSWYDWPGALRAQGATGADVQDTAATETGFKVEDVLNHLLLVCQRNEHLAIFLSESRRRNALVQSIKKGLSGLANIRLIEPEILNAAFVRNYEARRLADGRAVNDNPVRTLWLSGIHVPTSVKPDNKILAGRDLRDALDPLGDQTYCFTAARAYLGRLEMAVGVSPLGSRIWAGISMNWGDFENRLGRLLGELETTEEPVAMPLPILAPLRTDAESRDCGLSEPFELQVVPPELLVNDPSAECWTRERVERWAYRASFDNLIFCESPLAALATALQGQEIDVSSWTLARKEDEISAELRFKLPADADLEALNGQLQEEGTPVRLDRVADEGDDAVLVTINGRGFMKDERNLYWLQADVSIEGEQAGRLKLEIDVSDPQDVKIQAHSQEVDERYQEDFKEICRNTDWIKIWFESGETIANKAIYTVRHRDQPFSGFRWADFDGYEVDWEKFWEGNPLARVYGSGFSAEVLEKVKELDGVLKAELDGSAGGENGSSGRYLMARLEEDHYKAHGKLKLETDLKNALEAAEATVEQVHWHGTKEPQGEIGKHGSLFCWVLRNWADNSVNDESLAAEGWLACDDGSGEIADFIHLAEGNPAVLSLIHVKGAKSDKPDRQISVGPYDVVATQAVKNLRFLDRYCMEEGLARGMGKQISKLVWHNGRESTREAFCEALQEKGISYRRRVIILQPHITKGAYREASRSRNSSNSGKKPSRELERLRQLDTLLLSAEASCRGLGAEFFVLADRSS